MNATSGSLQLSLDIPDEDVADKEDGDALDFVHRQAVAGVGADKVERPQRSEDEDLDGGKSGAVLEDLRAMGANRGQRPFSVARSGFREGFPLR